MVHIGNFQLLLNISSNYIVQLLQKKHNFTFRDDFLDIISSLTFLNL